jgi:hypothetical protein
LPAELGLLPKKGRIKGSESYIKEKYMGLPELNNVIFADYACSEGNEYRCFLVMPSRGDTSAGMWETLSGKWKAVEHKGNLILHRDIPYEGEIGIIRKNDRIFGVSRVSDADEMLMRLDDLIAVSPD